MSDGKPMEIGPIKDTLPKPQGKVAKSRKPKIEILDIDHNIAKIPQNAPAFVDLTSSLEATEPEIEIIQTVDSSRLTAPQLPDNAPNTITITHKETRDFGVVGFLQKLGDTWRSFSNTLLHQDHFEKEAAWWGNDDKALKRMQAHQRATDKLGNNLVNLKNQVEKLEKIITEEKPDAELQITIVEPEIENKELIAEIQELYGGENYPTTSHTLGHHLPQTYRGQVFEGSNRPVYSCTVRSVLNGLDALNIHYDLTEGDLINGFGLNNFTPEGFLHTWELVGLEQVIPNVEVLSTPVTTLVEAINILKSKGVIVFSSTREAHSILISGTRNLNNHLEFMINDPFSSEGKWIGAEDLVSRHNPLGTELFGLFSKRDYYRDSQGDIVQK